MRDEEWPTSDEWSALSQEGRGWKPSLLIAGARVPAASSARVCVGSCRSCVKFEYECECECEIKTRVQVRMRKRQNQGSRSEAVKWLWEDKDKDRDSGLGKTCVRACRHPRGDGTIGRRKLVLCCAWLGLGACASQDLGCSSVG